MKIQFRCGCGLVNHSWEDWICHFKYRSFKSGIKNLLLTRIEVKNNENQD